LKKNNKPIVISHGSIADIWHLSKDKNNQRIPEEYALWNRKEPKENSEIFNIFGHTLVKQIDIVKHYINVDIGCYIKKVILQNLVLFVLKQMR